MSELDSVSAVGSDFQKLVTRYVLAVFFYSLDGESWFSSDGWLDWDRDECTWEYVKCEADGTILKIDVGGTLRNMRGTLPSELERIPTLREYTHLHNVVESALQ
jgi:hypothetical protein